MKLVRVGVIVFALLLIWGLSVGCVLDGDDGSLPNGDPSDSGDGNEDINDDDHSYDLEGSQGSVRGLVVTPDGGFTENSLVQIEVVGESDIDVNVTFDDQLECYVFSFAAPEGTYTLDFSKEEYDIPTVEVEVTAGEQTEFEQFVTASKELDGSLFKVVVSWQTEENPDGNVYLQLPNLDILNLDDRNYYGEYNNDPSDNITARIITPDSAPGVYAMLFDISTRNAVSGKTQESIRSESNIPYGFWKCYVKIPSTLSDLSSLKADVFNSDGFVESIEPDISQTGLYWDILQIIDGQLVEINQIQDEVYPLGSTGPGGGFVFFDKGTYDILDPWIMNIESDDHDKFIPSDTQNNNENSWRYLEAAAAGWSGESTDPEFSVTDAEDECEGFEDSYEKDDWYLPSVDELALIAENLWRNNEGGFFGHTGTMITAYWSATIGSAGENFCIDNGYNLIEESSDVQKFVRPVRRF